MWRTLLLVMAAQREVFPQYHHNVNKLKSVLGIQGDDDPPTEVLDLTCRADRVGCERMCTAGGAFAMPGEAMAIGSDSRMLFIASRIAP